MLQIQGPIICNKSKVPIICVTNPRSPLSVTNPRPHYLLQITLSGSHSHLLLQIQGS